MGMHRYYCGGCRIHFMAPLRAEPPRCPNGCAKQWVWYNKEACDAQVEEFNRKQRQARDEPVARAIPHPKPPTTPPTTPSPPSGCLVVFVVFVLLGLLGQGLERAGEGGGGGQTHGKTESRAKSKSRCGDPRFAPDGIGPSDWIHYECRKSSKREGCFSRREYSSEKGTGCRGGSKRRCCPPRG